MKKSHVTALILAIIGFAPSVVYMQELHLLPTPQTVELSEKMFTISKKLDQKSAFDISIYPVIQEQLALLHSDFKINGTDSGRNTLWYGIVDEDDLLDIYCQKNLLEIPMHDEGYVCHLQNDTIIIAARHKKGLLYGLYTLEQVLANANHSILPEVAIADYPQFENRAIMDDISRGPLSKMTFLKTQIKSLAKLKINQLSFYIEHVVKTKNHPDFAPSEGITIEEFSELSEFAKHYHIELIGSFQSLGHFRSVLNSETYRHLGQTDRMIKPGDSASIQFLQSIYAEMIPAFSSEYFNINSDEAWDLVRMEGELVVDSSAASQRYLSHVNPLLNYVMKSEKKPMIWSDMLLSFPQTIDRIPKETTVLVWEYGSFTNYDKWIDPFRAQDLDYWVCPGIVNSDRVFPDYEMTLTNIEEFINAGHEKDAKGVMTTIWDDGSSHFFARDWPAVAFAASQSWNPTRNNQKRFDRDFSFLMLNAADQSVLNCISQISELANTKAIENLGTAFLQEYLVPSEGETHYLHTMESGTISKIIQEGKTCFFNISEREGLQSNSWLDDLEAWQLTLDQLALQVTSYEKLIQLSTNYKQGKQLEKISQELTDLNVAWNDIKTRFTTLWLQENRTYFLKEVTAIYDRKIDNLSTLKSKIDDLLMTAGPLPSALSIGFDIRPIDKSYFTYWLISDKYQPNTSAVMDKEYITDLGGEANAIPTPYDWTKYQSPYSDKISFEDFFNDRKPGVVYLYSRIEIDDQQEVQPRITFAGAWKMIVNGKEIDDNESDQILLKKGKNHIILKLQLTTETQQLRFNLKDIETTNNKYRYKIKEQ